MINPRDIRAAEHIVDESGIVEKILAARQRSNRGRRTDPDAYRLFFIGGFLNVLTRGNFVIGDIHETLTKRIPLDEQFRLRVRRTRGSDGIEILSVHDLYNVSKALSCLDYGHGTEPDLDPEERQRRHHVVRSCIDDLMDVFAPWFTTRTQAIDATGIWAWGKGSWRTETTDTSDGDFTDP